MRRYMYTILLCISCLIALPFITKKVFSPFFEAKKNTAENMTDVEKEDDEEIYYATPPEKRKDAEEVPEAEKTPDTIETPGSVETPDSVPAAPEPEEKLKFTKVERDYFKDALFIGDSRTVGLSEYADLNGAHVFADTGMSVYKIHEKTVNIKGVGKTTLKKLLKNQKYGKIYVMLGINELGYDTKQTVRKFGELIEEIRSLQPDSIVFIGANLHVTESKSASSDIYNNKNINRFNKGIKKLADGKDIFYIDVNEIFDDGNGNLDTRYTVDESHVLGKYYSDWADWILEKGIVK